MKDLVSLKNSSLEKWGFKKRKREKGFSNTRERIIEEVYALKH